jgi:hypothetical protein
LTFTHLFRWHCLFEFIHNAAHGAAIPIVSAHLGLSFSPISLSLNTENNQKFQFRLWKDERNFVNCLVYDLQWKFFVRLNLDYSCTLIYFIFSWAVTLRLRKIYAIFVTILNPIFCYANNFFLFPIVCFYTLHLISAKKLYISSVSHLDCLSGNSLTLVKALLINTLLKSVWIDCLEMTFIAIHGAYIFRYITKVLHNQGEKYKFEVFWPSFQ